MRFPLGQAFSQVCHQPGRRLVAFLGRFREQFQTDNRDDLWHILPPLAKRNWMSPDMAVTPFHRIGSDEGKASSQHLVKPDPERIEIAPGIDRTIHSSGL